MSDRAPITRTNYDIVALTTYLTEQCPGAAKYHFVFAKPHDDAREPEHLTCTLEVLFNLLLEKQDLGFMVYVEIAKGIFCVPAGVPDIRLDPPPTVPADDARAIAVLSKDATKGEWSPSDKPAAKTDAGKARGRPKSGGKRPGGASAAADDELIPALGSEHIAMLTRRGWTESMITASGLGTITDAAILAALGPRGASPAPYGLAIPYGIDEDGSPKGRRVQLEVADTGDGTAMARASVWDRATLSPYVPAPVVKDGRLIATDDCPDPLVIVFDELDAHVIAELGQRVIGIERLEAMRIRIEGVETLHPAFKELTSMHGADVLLVGYPAVPGRRLLEARRAGRWLYDAGARKVRFLGTTQTKLSECVVDPAYWETIVSKATVLEKDVCGEPYTTMRDALPPDVAAHPLFKDALGMYVPEGYDIDPIDGSLSTVRPAGYANGVEMTKQVLISRSPIVPVARVVTARRISRAASSRTVARPGGRSCMCRCACFRPSKVSCNFASTASRRASRTRWSSSGGFTTCSKSTRCTPRCQRSPASLHSDGTRSSTDRCSSRCRT
jgi:hypothetical protein